MLKLTKDLFKKSGIYCISNTIDDRVYIGSTVYFKERLDEHKRDLLKNKHHCIHLQRFVDKYGIDTLTNNVAEIIDDVNLLLIREQFYLDTTPNLFNTCKIAGKGNPIRSFTEEQIIEVANLYNSGMRISEIAKMFNYNSSMLSRIKLGKFYHTYNHYFKLNIFPNKVSKNFNKEDILKIAELYNLGNDCQKISNILFDGKYYQSIVRLSNGTSNKEYHELFNYKSKKTNSSNEL